MTVFMIDLSIESHYSVLGVSPDADVKEIRKAKDDRVNEIKLKLRETKDPDEIARLEEAELAASIAGNTLGPPAERAKYDQENAHLKFFIIQSAAIPLYTSSADRAYVLHRVMRAFLAEKGCHLPPLTDLERDDFSADETPVELLDRLLK
jgi:hypothetical protein